MKRLLPPHLTILCVAAMAILHALAPIAQLLALPGRLAGLVPLATGVWLAVAGSNRFQREGTNIKTFNKPDVLVTDGLFGFSRNPMYLGLTLTLLGVALLLGSLSPLAVVAAFFAVCNLWYIPFEEDLALQTFGEPYTAYRHRVRRWL